ncbi:MAG: phosphoketolase [Parcubacteria group bacterium Licking1014_17]|nr:MAG: phosphoketolase [Parcubacteria group bacterium Licking1014_17]
MIENIKKLFRAANYLSAVQIYLQDNFLLKESLKKEHIKPRLLGHWGSVPGITFTYANLAYLVKKYSASIMFVLGPGHGYPGLRSNLFIEGTLGEYDEKAKRDYDGIAYLAKSFSWPYGSPSHSNPGTPGAIVEGGELGYSLSTSFGSVLDNPDLITACLIGDGEAETGALAAAWHANKLLDPAGNGAVLPILHLNGYKISGPTIFGRMSNRELKALFTGYGYEPMIIEFSPKIFEKAVEVFESAYQKIKEIQKKAGEEKVQFQPRWPMIILKTPKGWTGPKSFKGLKLEGNYASHQVVCPDAKTNKSSLKTIEKWLHGYKFEELYEENTGFCQDIKDLLPEGDLRMGKNRHAFSGQIYKPLKMPDLSQLEIKISAPGREEASSMKALGEMMKRIFALNREEKNFRLFSPDETYSNKLDAVFEETKRAWVLPGKKWDKDMAPDGRVMELLSEQTLEGLMEGYILTGRHAALASYEAFIEVIASMADQHVKFLKEAKKYPWRNPIASTIYILTSPGWRQDHNGFSHQNPGFVSGMLEKHVDFVNAYFPADANTTLAAMDNAFRSTNEVNLLVAGKTPEPQWRTMEEAKRDVERGIATWNFASEENPDLVMCGVGDYLTKEVLAAISILKETAPEIKIRFVNVSQLTTLGLGREKDPLTKEEFAGYFAPDKPVIVNFYGYPAIAEHAFFKMCDRRWTLVNGYRDQGSTTTPFDMQLRNRTSRFHLVIQAIEFMKAKGVVEQAKAERLTSEYTQKIREHRDYAIAHGEDQEEITNWKWSRTKTEI